MHCMNCQKNPPRGRDRAWSQSLVYFIIEKLFILSVEIRISPCDKLFNEKEFTLFNEPFMLKAGSLNLLVKTVLKSDNWFSRYCIINFFKCNISFNCNAIDMEFSVINCKMFSAHVPEKILKIGQSVQKL